MAYNFDADGVLGVVSALITAVLAQAGEPPGPVPLATTAEQVAALAGRALPLTVIQVDSFAPDGESDQVNVGAIACELTLLIHHLRALEPGTGVAAVTALRRMSALAAEFQRDYRLTGYGGGGVPVQETRTGRIEIGDRNPVQMWLAQTGQNVSLAAASFALTVQWVEYPA